MLRTINLPCAGAGAGACLPFASAGEGRTEGRIVDDWSIVAGNANGVPGLEGPPLGQTVREIWRALDAVGRYVTLMRRASSEGERQAYISAIDRQSARLDALGRVVVEQCRAGLMGAADGWDVMG